MGAGSNQFAVKIAELEAELETCKADSAVLNEEMMTKYQIIEDLQNQLEKKEKECSEKDNLMAANEIEKDDIIRDLKLKLEAAPEDITVPVDTSAMMAEAEKTKSELQSM